MEWLLGARCRLGFVEFSACTMRKCGSEGWSELLKAT